MPLYEGPATIVMAEGRSFEIVCTVRSSRERGYRSVFASRRVGAFGADDWGGSFTLVDPRDRGALTTATVVDELVTLRLGDGREASGYLAGGRLRGSGDWPPPLIPAA